MHASGAQAGSHPVLELIGSPRAPRERRTFTPRERIAVITATL